MWDMYLNLLKKECLFYFLLDFLRGAGTGVGAGCPRPNSPNPLPNAIGAPPLNPPPPTPPKLIGFPPFCDTPLLEPFPLRGAVLIPTPIP